MSYLTGNDVPVYTENDMAWRKQLFLDACAETERLTAVVKAVEDLLNQYDESCDDRSCECCDMWKGHVGEAIDQLRAATTNTALAVAHHAPVSRNVTSTKGDPS